MAVPGPDSPSVELLAQVSLQLPSHSHGCPVSPMAARWSCVASRLWTQVFYSCLPSYSHTYVPFYSWGCQVGFVLLLIEAAQVSLWLPGGVWAAPNFWTQVLL